MLPCTIPNTPYPWRPTKLSRDNAAHRMDNSIDRRASSGVAGNGVHSSSAMVIVASSLCWIAMDRAGVRRWLDPSMCDWNVTPSASIFRSFAVLVGPITHLKHLVSKERLPFSAAYIASLSLTLYFSISVSFVPP